MKFTIFKNTGMLLSIFIMSGLVSSSLHARPAVGTVSFNCLDQNLNDSFELLEETSQAGDIIYIRFFPKNGSSTYIEAFPVECFEDKTTPRFHPAIERFYEDGFVESNSATIGL